MYALTDLDLASRLSFFLWSSIPDDELLRAAEQGRLTTPAVLRQQVRRMLRRSEVRRRCVDNFAGQWLYLRNLKNMVPLSTEFVDFDDNLRRAFAREAELFFASVMRENRSVLDLMTADYTFVNERLAKHYGIPERLRQPLPPRHADRRSAPRHARQGRDPDGDVARRSHVAGGARQVGARQPARRAAAADARQRAAARRDGQQAGRVLTMRERMEAHRAQSGVRQLPQDHGPDRPGARELRRRRRVAHASKAARTAPRSTRRA